jgi:hypothetical protein
MKQRDVSELAAILVSEHGSAALQFAERRRAQFAVAPASESCRLWARIAAATARLLRSPRRRVRLTAQSRVR